MVLNMRSFMDRVPATWGCGGQATASVGQMMVLNMRSFMDRVPATWGCGGQATASVGQMMGATGHSRCVGADDGRSGWATVGV